MYACATWCGEVCCKVEGSEKVISLVKCLCLCEACRLQKYTAVVAPCPTRRSSGGADPSCVCVGHLAVHACTVVPHSVRKDSCRRQLSLRLCGQRPEVRNLVKRANHWGSVHGGRRAWLPAGSTVRAAHNFYAAKTRVDACYAVESPIATASR